MSCMPAPVSREEYEKDSRANSRARAFMNCWARRPRSWNWMARVTARRVTVLRMILRKPPGPEIVLNQSDVMIAIWDGDPGKKGGTGQFVAEAEHSGFRSSGLSRGRRHISI